MAKLELGVVPLGQITVAAAGTRVPLSATSLLVRQATIQWVDTNAGKIYIGDVTVDATHGLVLSDVGSTLSLTAEDTVADGDNIYFDLSKIYIDAATSGDKVSVMYTTLLDRAYTN